MSRSGQLELLALANGGLLVVALAWFVFAAPLVLSPFRLAALGVLLLSMAGALLLRRRIALEGRKQAEQQARAAGLAQGRLLGHVSHEIRTPLNGVLGMADLLLHSKLTPEQREQVRLIQTSAEALLALVSDAPRAAEREVDLHRRARRDRTILVVDDRSTNRSVALALLRELGFAAEAVESGEAALAALTERRFHAVLLDCEMPGLDGLETCRRLRRQEASARHASRIPVIAVTAHTSPEEKEKCRAAGMDDSLVKPFRTAELAAVLDVWLGIEAEERRASGGDGLEERLAALKALEQTTGKSVVGAFLQQGEEDLATLRRALPQEDREAFAGAAHALAGSAGLLGAAGLAEKAAELAGLARQGDLSGCAARLPELEQAWREIAGRL